MKRSANSGALGAIFSSLCLAAVTTVGCSGSATSGLSAADGAVTGDTENASDGGDGASDETSTPSDALADATPDVALDPDAPVASEVAVEAGDHGAPSTTFPAFPVDIGTIVTQGGPSMKAPVVVTVTWSTEPNVALYESFGDTIGASTYWHTINSEYGVGPTTSGKTNHVHIPVATAPTAITDMDVETMLTKQLTDPKSGWPAPTPQTVYAFYIPGSAAFTESGSDACAQGTGGYHTDIAIAGAAVSYAVMLNCPGGRLDDVMVTAAHELNEVATDPFPQSNAGFVGFDTDHLAWEFASQGTSEVGDACQYASDNAFTTAEPGFKFAVQRQWSNVAALAGHDPCVPSANTTPWFDLTLFPAQEVDILADLTTTIFHVKVTTKGFKTAVGVPITFQVGFVSDAATSGPWAIEAFVDNAKGLTDGSGATIPNGTATVTLDKTTGVNGEKANVTVTPKTFGPLGVVFVRLSSTLAGAADPHDLPILISAK